MEVISRKEAKEIGLKKYFTGKPCKHGHVSHRYVANSCCQDCLTENQVEYYSKNRGARLAYWKEYTKKNPEIVAKNRVAWREMRRAKRPPRPPRTKLSAEDRAARKRASSRRRYRNNRDEICARQRERYRKDSARYLARAVEYYARRRMRSVPWANRNRIEWFYREAKRLTDLTGVIHEVDHIVPLHGELISGLHVETNLQVLTRRANREKSNSFSV